MNWVGEAGFQTRRPIFIGERESFVEDVVGPPEGWEQVKHTIDRFTESQKFCNRCIARQTINCRSLSVCCLKRQRKKEEEKEKEKKAFV